MTVERNDCGRKTTHTEMADLLIGESPVMQQLRMQIARVAPSSLPVLIQGPTGAGKELVASALHRWSGRSGGFVAFNVCALGDSMFEDALFGHVRGAFTGAMRDAPGYLLEGDRGTVFMDEIAGLPMNAQAKLLRAIETRRFRPVGAHHDRNSEFRLLAASNDDLSALVAGGEFRADLAYRLRGMVINVPPLSARRSDIPLLARRLLEQNAPNACLELSSDAAAELMAHEWAGNVRELRYVVERAALYSSGRTIGRTDVRLALPAHATTLRVPEPNPATLLARRRLEELLDATKWDTAEVAQRLGVHRATVYRHMKRFGLEISSGPRTIAAYGRLRVQSVNVTSRSS